MQRKFSVGVLLGVSGTVFVAAAIWLMLAYSGMYNVAASEPHSDLVRWTLDTTMRRSIVAQSDNIDLPEQFPAEVVAEGAHHYNEYCAHCHGTPDGKASEWSRGMRPEPPHLAEAASEWSREEMFWIISNGIKMTGMPAFGVNHSDEEITSLVAFVDALPGMTGAEYAQITGTVARKSE